jgi:hypothetical protein
MKILVGILHCIENEFPDCLAALRRQTHRNYDYFVLENLPNKEAHDTLYCRFMDSASSYDVFVKLDADMVLCREDLLARAADRFKNSPQLDVLCIGVHDFFTDQMIDSLNVFRNTVSWRIDSEKIFPDRGQQAAGGVMYDHDDLAPAADHCPDPSPFQAFHFGVHKAVKVMQIGVHNKRRQASREHWGNLERLRANYAARKDVRLGLALVGAEMAFHEKWGAGVLDYGSPILKSYFDKVSAATPAQVDWALRARALRSFSFLPPPSRHQVLERMVSPHLWHPSNCGVWRTLVGKVLRHPWRTS